MKKQEKISFIAFIMAIIITVIFMFGFIVQKSGWHEDEIFSYGSSNCKYDNLFCTFADKDSLNQVMDKKIKNKSPIKMMQNVEYYITHPNEFMQSLEEKIQQETPIWKTKEQAKDYITVSNDEVFSYWSVYYNQSRDVHPPLFYILVHFISSLALNQFSKYIIFSINLGFYIAACLVIRKIMKLFNKEGLSAIVVLLYGLSMGALSIVMFQRMYMMLTFFVLKYIYLNLKISKNDFKIDKAIKGKLVLTTILGFLTQYYFCIYAVFIAGIIALTMAQKKKWIELKQYIWCHIKAAIIGVVIFPASIYHIFFSYRGAAGGLVNTSYIGRIKEYLGLIFYAFSIPEKAGYFIIAALTLVFIIKLLKTKRKYMTLIISVPVILFTVTVAKIAPFVNIRYIAPILPVISIAIIAMGANIIRYILAHLLRNSQMSKVGQIQNSAGIIILGIFTIVISSHGLLTSKPQFLYTDYAKRIELAEQYQDLKLVYVGQSSFNHIQDIEEFLRYRQTLITNTWNLEALKDNKGLENEKEFILNIKCWISDFDNNLSKILEYTGATSYELLVDDGASRVYKVYRK